MPKIVPISLKQCKNPYVFLATGFGSGCSPYAPGTMGSLIAIPIIYCYHYFNLPYFLIFTIIVNLVGVWICEKATQKLKVHDHGGIVWDEIGGMLVTFIFIPVNIFNLMLGFLLFRLFDILKPFPISYIDKKVTGGLGIMLDDIVAGIAACLCLTLLQSYL